MNGLFEMLEKAGQDVGKSTKWILMSNLKRYGVDIKTSARVLSIRDKAVTFEIDGNEETRVFDAVVMASGAIAADTLEKEILSLNISFSTVGDCIKPGKINDAIHGGFLTAIKI